MILFIKLFLLVICGFWESKISKLSPNLGIILIMTRTLRKNLEKTLYLKAKARLLHCTGQGGFWVGQDHRRRDATQSVASVRRAGRFMCQCRRELQ